MAKIPRLSSCIFDLDGTLVDSLHGIQHSAQCAVDAVAPGAVLPNLAPFIGPPVREVLQRALMSCNATPDDAMLDALERAFRGFYDGEGCTMAPLFPGMADVVDRLTQRKIACYILTNKPRHATEAIVAATGLHRRLRGVICRDSQSPPFASKASALAALMEQHTIEMRQAILIGDTLEDAHAAAAAAVQFIGVAWGYGNLSAAINLTVAATAAQLFDMLESNLDLTEDGARQETDQDDFSRQLL